MDSEDIPEHTLERPLVLPYIQSHYQPSDGPNFWMFAMIGMGCAFVAFVIGSIYLMCKSQQAQPMTPTRRHPTKSRVEQKSMLGGTSRHFKEEDHDDL